MALQPRIIACGTKRATVGMVIRFLCGPIIMSAASVAVGLRGVKLHAAIVQVPYIICTIEEYMYMHAFFLLYVPIFLDSTLERERVEEYACICFLRVGNISFGYLIMLLLNLRQLFHKG